ncbi:MAG: translation initiation factor IF-2 [Parcubacteria group bacterium 21-54-25]|nr:MAG: translation initiation factor IF-2 [Parcubacteria group bacterium 21-54-25]HQU07912.1 translation initiation factor IF-2 [Candidatus Paceibacterota bacterium]
MARTNRPPIIAVMGHIDHGKSSLLDYIRKSNTVAGESGGITQHVSAYEVEHVYEGAPRRITFLDTPGHEAFHALRARGASVADVAILVVAADEGVKPQTLDALAAINEAGIPYVVALTKIDKREADVERAKTSLLENEVYLEGLGGAVPYAPISSKSGEGVPALLDLVLLAADLAELSADAHALAAGFVLESTQDPRRGLSATLIVKEGTLTTGVYVVAGEAYAPVRFMENFLGVRVMEAGPSSPVHVAGFSALPPAGTPFVVVTSRKEAQARHHEKSVLSPKHTTTGQAVAQDVAVMPLVIKADVTGSLEAIAHELTKIAHEHAQLHIVATGVGAVTENDVKMAHAASGVVVAFHVSVEASARDLAMRMSVPVETFTIIYDLSERINALLLERAPHVTKEEALGEAKILRTFSATARKRVAGARLVSGSMAVGALVRIMRRDIELGRGKITNLQQARADVREIRTEGEFGLEIETKADVAGGDTITAYTIVEA